MAEKMRYNKIIDLLEQGKPVFSTSTVPNGSLDDLTYIADADYDAVIIEMEHEGFSFTTLRTSLQVLLNRKRIAETGNLQPDVVPMVRIPPNARERNQWVIKLALDSGVYRSGVAPPEHSGGRPSRSRGGAVSPGARGARLCRCGKTAESVGANPLRVQGPSHRRRHGSYRAARIGCFRCSRTASRSRR